MGKVWSTGGVFGWEDATSLVVHEAILCLWIVRLHSGWAGWQEFQVCIQGFDIMYLGTSLVVPNNP